MKLSKKDKSHPPAQPGPKPERQRARVARPKAVIESEAEALTNPKAWEEARRGWLGVMVDDPDLSAAWSAADQFAMSQGKKVIQDESPEFLRRHERLHYFFPYNPAESVLRDA